MIPWTVQSMYRPEYWSGYPVPSLGDLPNPGIELGSLALWADSLALRADSLPAEPPGKPKNTGVGSRSLLQRIFPPPGAEPGSPALQADPSPAELPVVESQCCINFCCRAAIQLHTYIQFGGARIQSQRIWEVVTAQSSSEV